MSLYPFFSYFGSKFRLAGSYDKPRYSTIIEPFAGSAGYSLLYPKKKIRLYDLYEPIVVLWDYLIHVSPSEILQLPITSKDGHPFDKEHPVDECTSIPEGARYLLGFWLTESQTHASRYPLSKSRGGNWGERKRQRIADQVDQIKHWSIEQKSYSEIPYDGREATWFVDPPYEDAGKRYRHNAIDYSALGSWCQSRRGQTIVCEQFPAKWMPFQPFQSVNNASNKPYREVVYYGQS